MLAEQHDEWTEMRRYIGLDVLKRARLALIPTEPNATQTQEVTTAALSA